MLEAVLERIEGSQSACGQQVHEHDRHRPHRRGSSEWDVSARSLIREDGLTNIVFRVPSARGMMKSPNVNEKVKVEPATTPGKASGRITVRKV